MRLIPWLFQLGAASTASATISGAQTCDDRPVIAFVGADVLTMSDSILRRAQHVLVRRGRIDVVGATSIPADACRIDARNKVLLPGLVDMHVHTSAREMPLFLANGVTLIREMNGSPRHLAMRDSIATGTLLGPKLLVASTLLTGQKWPVRYRLIEDVNAAKAAAREMKNAGYDYLKIYDGLSRDQYDAFVELGRTLGISLDGHIPQDVGLRRVLEAGQALQHMDKIAVAIGGHPPDVSKLDEAAKLFHGRSAWVTPTLASLRVLDRAGTAEYAARFQNPEIAYVDSSSFGWWRSFVRSGTRQAAASPYYQFQTALLKVLRTSGARFLLGTDAANPMMVAGFSVHEEMQVLVEDGSLSRYEVLLAATRNAAQFLGDTLGGQVRVGARADLILVDGNPLEDLAPLKRPIGVMIGGRWLGRAQLDAMLQAARIR
ncbi:MAG TPA: amidohydrolase family protein [Gemmatimonadaceae bacterium]|nr:amidohydrolase family protein [Gemmatimonadaceae bacterium]